MGNIQFKNLNDKGSIQVGLRIRVPDKNYWLHDY